MAAPLDEPRTSSLERQILLADADAFFVAVARLADPEVAGRKPLLVVGGAATRRGVVTSASYETRRFGVRSGMPMAQALRLCPQATRVPVAGELCRRKSHEIKQVLSQFTPIVEPASIDEFYLDMTGTAQLYDGESLAAIAATIRQAVSDRTGLKISIGGGTSRLIAKLAAKRAKPHNDHAAGVFIVQPGKETQFLSQLNLADIPGVGPRLQARLAKHGLSSVQQALAIDPESLTAWFGERTGRWLHSRIRGIDAAPVVSHVAAKSLSREETFAIDLESDRDIEREVLRKATRIAADLRGKGFFARTISVRLRDADFTTRQASSTFDAPTASDRPIRKTVRKLLRQLRAARRTGVRLIGVSASNLVTSPKIHLQLSLLSESSPERDRDRLIIGAVDDINSRFGRGCIVRGIETPTKDRSSKKVDDYDSPGTH